MKFIHRDQIENVYKKDKFKKIITDKGFQYLEERFLYISDYYLDGGYEGVDFLGYRRAKDFKYEYDSPHMNGYELADNERYRWHMLDNFFPICNLKEEYKLDKKNNIIEKSKIFLLYYADLNTKKKFSEFNEKKSFFLRQYNNLKYFSEQSILFREFVEKIIKKKIQRRLFSTIIS